MTTDKFCRDCRHFRDLHAEWRAEQEPVGFWSTFLAPPRLRSPPPFTPYRCEREISPVTGAPTALDAGEERSAGSSRLHPCGPSGQFWEPRP